MKPYLIVEWNDIESEAHGWLCIHNLVKGLAGGGTRMHPSVTREEVMRLAEIMAYKYNAAGIPDCGGCKAGIVYDNKAPDARDVLKRFFAAMRPYVEIGLALGNDLGTTGPEIAAIRSELGMATMTETKSQLQDMQMRANMQKKAKLLHEKYDVFTVNDAMTGYGTAACADVAWRKLHGAPNGAKVLVQGFGNVGASAAYRLHQLGYKVVGISDARQLVVCEDGLDVPYLYEHRTPYLEMDTETLKSEYKVLPNTEWMNVECDIFIPAALEAVINKDTVNKITATVISEGGQHPHDRGGRRGAQGQGRLRHPRLHCQPGRHPLPRLRPPGPHRLHAGVRHRRRHQVQRGEHRAAVRRAAEDRRILPRHCLPAVRADQAVRVRVLILFPLHNSPWQKPRHETWRGFFALTGRICSF